MGPLRPAIVWLLGVSTLLGFAPACDLLGPTTSARTPRPEGPAPVIDTLQAQPPNTRSMDQPLTLTASAHAPAGMPLQYNWTADMGTLSSQSGMAVTWRPTTADGVLQPGSATISLTVTSGAYSSTARMAVLVGTDGSVATNVAPRIYGPPVPATGSAKPASQGTPSASSSTSPAASGAASPLPTGCTVRDLVPTWAAPGSVVYVRGQGLTMGNIVTMGGAGGAILNVAQSGLAVKVPPSLPLDGSPVPVALSGCGTLDLRAGLLAVVDTSAFGGSAVTQAGQGIIADVGAIDAGAQSVPDLSKLKPVGSYLLPNLDFAATSAGGRFPPSSTDLSSAFGVRFAGQISPGLPGKTQFSLVASEGAKLYIDGKLIADDEPGQATASAVGTVDLTAGKHAIRVDLYEASTANFALHLYWTPPGSAQPVIVPPEVFSPAL